MKKKERKTFQNNRNMAVLVLLYFFSSYVDKRYFIKKKL